MGVDARHEEPVNFDICSPEFLDAYFDVLHHPLEKQGVDFWWIDWQQGKNSKIDGLDPLWMLNRCHYLDNGRDGKRPMTCSRYAGPGSHRYPLRIFRRYRYDVAITGFSAILYQQRIKHRLWLVEPWQLEDICTATATMS